MIYLIIGIPLLFILLAGDTFMYNERWYRKLRGGIWTKEYCITTQNKVIGPVWFRNSENGDLVKLGYVKIAETEDWTKK